jgi:hypothetical protein
LTGSGINFGASRASSGETSNYSTNYVLFIITENSEVHRGLQCIILIAETVITNTHVEAHNKGPTNVNISGDENPTKMYR